MSETVSALVSPASGAGMTPALYVGLAGDAPRTAPARIGLGRTDRVALGRGDARTVRRTSSDDIHTIAISLADVRMSGQHARLSRIGTAWALEDLGSKNGTWIAGERVTRHVLVDGDAFVLGHTAIVFCASGGELPDLDAIPHGSPGLVTLAPALARRFDELARAARSTVPIEICGETGTGKELAARGVHALSGRSGAFVAVNCGALAGSLLEAELFGHRKGAFTGAAGDRLGLVRSADGGTLFLDEVAELPPASQAALLRVLQEREVVPVGTDTAIQVDLRIVTATHKRLDAEVAAGRFRADLRARVLGLAIELPALRERREDLGMLVATLLGQLAPGRAVAFSAEAVGAIYAYAWPLNIRELERALSAALAIADDRIELGHLPVALRERPTVATAAVPADLASPSPEVIRAVLVASLARHEGNLAAVARELGKDRTQIRRWMKRFGIARDS